MANKKLIVDPMGQWKHPGQPTRIPSDSITMMGISYPVLAMASNGAQVMMQPGMDYYFPGAEYVDEYPVMKSGGQHGGLDRWFAEKWVDIKTGKACGRQEGEKRKGYPACRPSRRVSSDTPKTASELSSAEREKFKRSKTSSERINYQHRRKQDGGETNDSDMANKPNNPELWSKAKSLAKQKFDVYPSAYANGWAAKWYKSKGGTWSKAEYGMEIMGDGGTPDNPGFRALPPAVQQKIIDNMAAGGEKMPVEIARARFAAAGNLDKLDEYGYAFGGYMPEMGYGGSAQQAAIAIAMKKAGKKPKSMKDGGDPDGEMALGQIDAAIDKLQKLRQFIQPDSDLEPWVSSKLTLMDHYTDAVADYMQYNPEAQEMDMMMKNGGQKAYYDDGRDAWVYEDGTIGPNGPAYMKNGGGIPERYRNMGFTKVGVKKESTRPGKKWMVLAKKGDQYKVVHGGYDGMKDFTQHGSEKRRERFWDRMGGKDSAKAKDPFSPLYWHKRFGTWKDGGYVGYDGKMHQSTTPTWSGNAGYEMGGYIPEAAYGGNCLQCGGSVYKMGGDIHIDPKNKGKFTAAAKKAGMGVQEFASHVLANKEDYSSTLVKRANFARNAAKWKKQEGGEESGGDNKGWIIPAAIGALALGTTMWANNKRKQIGNALMPMMMPGAGGGMAGMIPGAMEDGGPVIGDEMDVTPEQLELLRQQGYEFEII